MEDCELLKVEELFEDDDLILMRSKFNDSGINIQCTDVGIKDESGDIERVVTVDSKVLLWFFRLQPLRCSFFSAIFIENFFIF